MHEGAVQDRLDSAAEENRALVGYFRRDYHPCIKTFGPCRRSYHVGVVVSYVDTYCKEVVDGEDRYSHRLNGCPSRSNVETLVQGK